jgi:4-aminobutyrate aminotransferase-like enzyme
MFLAAPGAISRRLWRVTVLDEIHQTRGRSAELAERDRARICRATPRIPLVVERASGIHLFDTEGRRVLDFTSGWNVANTGWNHPAVISSVSRQLAATAFAPPWCTHPMRVAYAERLCATITGDYRVLSLATGSEAVEAALKIARRATGRHVVLGFAEAYHGGTLGSMLAGGVAALHGKDLPSSVEHRHVPVMHNLADPALYLEQVCAAIIAPPAPAAVLLEPFFTNPGILYRDRTFYQTVQRAARSVGALLILDEVGTGFGRTGKMFGFQHWGLEPDLIAVAKAIASGVIPMAATILRADLAPAVAGPGFSSTFGWTPLACAAAEATLNVLEKEELCERAGERGVFAKSFLRKHCRFQSVVDIRGEGLELGIELAGPDNETVTKTALRALTTALLRRGVFAETSSFTSTLLVMPPLTITEAELAAALEVVVEELGHWTETCFD